MQGGFGVYLANGDAEENFHFSQNGGDVQMRRGSIPQGTDFPEPILLSDLAEDEFERLLEANAQKLKQEKIATTSSSLSDVPESECFGQKEVQTENEKNFIKWFGDQPIPPGEISRLKAMQQLKHKQKQSTTQRNKNYYNFYQRVIDARTNPARDFRNLYENDAENWCLPRSSQAPSLREQITEATRHVDITKLSLESIALINMEDPVPPPTTDKNSIENAQLSVDNNFVIESRELQHSVNSDENILQAEKSKSSETVQNFAINTKEDVQANHTSPICEDDPQEKRRSQSASLVRKKSTELRNGHVDINTTPEETLLSNSESGLNLSKKDGPFCIYKDLDWNGEPEIDWEGKRRGIDVEKDKPVKATSKSVDVATNTDTNEQQKKDMYIFFDMNENVPDAPMLKPKLNGTSKVSDNAEWNKQAQPTSYTVLSESLNDAKPLDDQIRSVDTNVETATNLSKYDMPQVSRVNNLAAAITLAVMSSPEGCMRLSKLRTFIQKCYGHSLENDIYDLVKLGEFIQQNCGPNVTFNRRENNDALIVHRDMEYVETS